MEGLTKELIEEINREIEEQERHQIIEDCMKEEFMEEYDLFMYDDEGFQIDEPYPSWKELQEMARYKMYGYE